MIRFSCDTCKRSLRAPMPLAGKKGRCARCGAVNHVPAADKSAACGLARPASEEDPAQTVDVKRTAPPSPFRSTADVPVPSAIEGTVQLENAQFLSTTPVDSAIDEPLANSLAIIVPQNVNQADQAAIIHSPHARIASPIPASVVRIGDARDVLQNLAAEYHEPFAPTFEPRSVNLGQAVRAALVVGAVLGFCVGLIASKWLL